MVLAEGQTHRSTEKNRELRNRTTQYMLIDFDKGVKVIRWKKDGLFKIWRWSNWTSRQKKMNKNNKP